ncbi:hypothetical protein PDIDSM_3763 [Penicillium digitatum]|nr:hypothetical protein PDIDSM_3763 [Penicillium digitatum]
MPTVSSIFVPAVVLLLPSLGYQMSVVGSNRPDVHHVLLPSAAAKTSGSPETVKPVTVPVVALAFLPVRNMRGASHVVRRIRLLCQLCSLSLLLLDMNNPVVSATVAAVGKYPNVQLPIPLYLLLSRRLPMLIHAPSSPFRPIVPSPSSRPRDAYDTRASDISLSPDWNTWNTSAAPLRYVVATHVAFAFHCPFEGTGSVVL